MSQETDPKRSRHGNKYKTAIILLIMVVAIYLIVILKQW